MGMGSGILVWIQVSGASIFGVFTVCCFCLNSVPVRRDQFTSHHAETSKALCEDVRLHVAVVVLASPDEAS